MRRDLIRFHAAPVELLRSILVHGIQKRFSGLKPGRVFLANTPDLAGYYAAIKYGMIHPKSVSHEYFVTTCKAKVVIFAVRVSPAELFRDRLLENKRLSRRKTSQQADSVCTRQDIPRSRIVAYTIVRKTLKHEGI